MLSKISVRIVMCGVALALSLAANTAFAQGVKKVINAGSLNYYAPFEFKDTKTGELMGFDHDLVEAMAKKMGATVNWSEFSWAELSSFAPLKTGRVDIGTGVMGDTRERREAGVSFLDFVYEPYFFYTVKANANQFKNPDALCGKNVANTRSAAMIGAVNKWSEENCTSAGKPDVLQVVAANTPEQLLALKQGRAEAGFTGAGGLAQANMSEGNVYASIGKPAIKLMYGFAFLNSNKELGDSLKKALDELIADGTYIQLLHKWGLPEDDSSIGKMSSINAG